MESVDRLVVSTVVDNDAFVGGFLTSWGLSFHVRVERGGEEHEFLMDVDESPVVWIENAKKLGLEPRRVEGIFISHWHFDHYGALSEVYPLTGGAKVYGPTSFALGGIGVMPCERPTTIYPGVITTGSMGRAIREHGLVISVRDEGIVLLVGCSHPDVLNLLDKAMEVSGIDRVLAVMGGFHVSSRRDGERIGKGLMKRGVRMVAPMHCTGYEARDAIRSVVGDRYLENGAGRVIEF